MKWMMALGEELGGPSKAQAMLDGIGVSLILKSIEINFRRPVTYPDNVCIVFFLNDNLLIPFVDSC
jgi:hypothetical protein